MAGIHISKDPSGQTTVTFPYDPLLAAKLKTIPSHRWHPDDKYWSFPILNEIIKELLKVFEGEEIRIDSTLKSFIPNKQSAPPVASRETTVSRSSPQAEARGAENLEDLRREMVSKKYSYKTVKAYPYFNRDFLNHTGKSPPGIIENDIKNYILYLTEEKQSATSTLNQAINALKFYYGGMLKKKFLYEIKRPRKDKKLPVVLSKEEVAGNFRVILYGEYPNYFGYHPNSGIISYEIYVSRI